jgi:hypothetical protein
MRVTDESDVAFEERMRTKLLRCAQAVEVNADTAMKAVHLRTESLPWKPRRRGARVALLATAGLCGVLGVTAARPLVSADRPTPRADEVVSAGVPETLRMLPTWLPKGFELSDSSEQRPWSSPLSSPNYLLIATDPSGSTRVSLTRFKRMAFATGGKFAIDVNISEELIEDVRTKNADLKATKSGSWDVREGMGNRRVLSFSFRTAKNDLQATVSVKGSEQQLMAMAKVVVRSLVEAPNGVVSLEPSSGLSKVRFAESIEAADEPVTSVRYVDYGSARVVNVSTLRMFKGMGRLVELTYSLFPESMDGEQMVKVGSALGSINTATNKPTESIESTTLTFFGEEGYVAASVTPGAGSAEDSALLVRVAESLRPVTDPAFRKKLGGKFSVSNRLADPSTSAVFGTTSGVRWSLEIGYEQSSGDVPTFEQKPKPCCIRLRSRDGDSVERQKIVPAGTTVGEATVASQTGFEPAELLYAPMALELRDKRTLLAVFIEDNVADVKLVRINTNAVAARAKSKWFDLSRNHNVGVLVGPSIKRGKYRIDAFDSKGKLVKSIPVP